MTKQQRKQPSPQSKEDTRLATVQRLLGDDCRITTASQLSNLTDAQQATAACDALKNRKGTWKV